MSLLKTFAKTLSLCVLATSSLAESTPPEKLSKILHTDSRAIFIDSNTFFTSTIESETFVVAKFKMLVKTPVNIDKKSAHIFTVMIAANCKQQHAYTYNSLIFDSSSILIKSIPEMEKYELKNSDKDTSLVAIGYKALCEFAKEEKKPTKKLNELYV